MTNSPAAAVALADHRSAHVIVLGGDVDLTWMATVGSTTVDAWRSYQLDLAVLGACAFSPDRGVSTRSRSEVATKQALIAAASETLLPIQIEKLGAEAPFSVAPASAIDAVIFDERPKTALLKQIRASGATVDVAKV